MEISLTGNGGKLPRLSVNYEWGALKEVIVGTPFLRIGTSIPRFFKKYSPEGTFEYALEVVRQNPNKSLEELDPVGWEKVNEQVRGAVEILRRRGITVHELLTFEPDEYNFLENIMGSGSQFFPRDPVVVIGNRLIETAMKAICRRKERFPVRRTIREHFKSVDWISMPEPVPLWNDDDEEFPMGDYAFLEGGDVFVLGKDIFVGNTGNASSGKGIGWLQNVLGEEYRVHEVRMSGKFLHLDCAFATLRPGLALACKEAFIDGLPDYFRDWQIVEVPFEEAKNKLACNGMVLDDKTVLIADELPNLAERISRAGHEVITTPFSEVFRWGGSFRCWHHPLVRE